MKKYLAYFLALIIVISLIPQGIFTTGVKAATTGTNGDCTWTLEGTVLTISGVGDMSNGAPWGTNITSVFIEDSVKSIGAAAFSNCTSLVNVYIGNSVTHIANSAFSGCTSLSSIILPNSVSIIDMHAFAGCTSLTTVFLGPSVNSVLSGAFYGCTSLRSIRVHENNPYISCYDDVLFNKNMTELIQYPIGKSDTTYTIPHSVTTLSVGSFSECQSLTSIIIPISTTSIKQNAFSGCSNIEIVGYSGSLDDRNNITFGPGNNELLAATWQYNYVSTEDIELVKLPKTDYITGEYLDLSGAVLRVYFNDGTSEDIEIPHYFTYPNHTQYFCNKLNASDMISVSNTMTRDAAVGGIYFANAGEQTLTLTYFGQSISLPVTVTEKPVTDISINDDQKNLVVTVTYEDNTIQKMTALSFISGAGDTTPDVSNRYGELRTDKGIYYATFSTYNDGSMSLSMNGVTSNILENGCDWYDIYIEKQYGRYGYSVLGDMSSHLHPYNNKITASNINSVIDYSLLGEDLEYIETNDMYTTPEGYSNYGNWYNGQDVRNIILKKFAVDTIDLSLSIHYDSKNDRYPVLGTGAAAGPEYPATLTYKDNYWEMCWPILTPEASYAYSYAHFDDAGRILRFSASAPITDPSVLIGDAEYDSFEEALSAAAAGQTITLNADVVATGACTMLGADVTLDLNGHSLTVSNFITFGDVVDTTEGEGKLIISDDPTKAFTNLQENNSQMPLYDEDGYRFFRYSVLNRGTHTAADGKSMQFGTHVQLSNRKAYELLTKEKNGNTAITFHITYQGQTFDYTFKAETLALYGQTICDKYDNNVADKTGTVLVLTVIGFDPADGAPDIRMEVDYHSTRTLVHKKQSIH